MGARRYEPGVGWVELGRTMPETFDGAPVDVPEISTRDADGDKADTKAKTASGSTRRVRDTPQA